MIDPEDQHKANRERAAKDAQDSLQKKNEDLLKEIYFVSDDRLFHDNTTRTNRLLAHFSSLLVNLSKQAEKSTQKIINLTYALIVFTIVLIFIGFVQIVMMVNQNTKTDIKTKETTENKSQIPADQQHMQLVKPIKPSPIIPEKKQITNPKTNKNERNGK